MRSVAHLILAMAVAGPAAARGLPDDLKPRSTGVPASAIPGSDRLDEGRALLMASNPAQALSAFQVALAQAPQSVAALNGIAIAYDRLGRSDLARQHFEMALALEPDAADIAYNLGLALARAGQDRAAIAYLQRAAVGNDTRVAAAARRSLTQIAARLTAPAPTPVMAAATPAGPRIDMASSGEAVLVLAPPVAAPAVAAPTRMAAAAPPAAEPVPVEPVLAERLGHVAALTIPISLPVTASDAPPESPALVEPGAAPRRFAVLPAAPPAPSEPTPAMPHPLPPAERPAAPVVARSAVQRLPLAPMVLAQWRRAEPAVAAPAPAIHDQPAPLPAPDDGKAAIRLAIARLESLIDLIEVQRG